MSDPAVTTCAAAGCDAEPWLEHLCEQHWHEAYGAEHDFTAWEGPDD